MSQACRGRSRGENISPPGSPFLRSAASRSALVRLTKKSESNEKTGPCVQPRLLRGCSCRGPEQHSRHYYTFRFPPHSRISALALVILPRTAVKAGRPWTTGFDRASRAQAVAL